MKNNQFLKEQNPSVSRATVAAEFNQSGIVFPPSADEVARRAYLSYGNRVALPEHELQQWLEAERQLLIERHLTLAHGFHHRA